MNNDLISRSALKEDLRQYFTKGEALYQILTIIDNAPTVAYPFEKFRTLFCGTCQAYMRIEPERPQGEWIIVDDTEKFIAKCSVCGRIEDSRMIKDYPFCHCGAYMRGNNNENL